MVDSHPSRYMSDPYQTHWEQAKRALRYLKGTSYSVLMYGGAPSSKVVGWSDSDYASDICERRSRTGYVLMLNGELEKPTAANCGVVYSGGRVYGADYGH
jgi:hypothetical protein